MGRFLLLLAVSLLLSSGCGTDGTGKEPAASGKNRAYDTMALQRFRSEKDAFLRKGEDSPFPPEERKNFTGLRYFPPDSAYVCTAEYEPFKNPASVSMMMTTGDPVTMIRTGIFTFRIDGESVELTAYKNPEDPQRLFLPFRDATNGESTYWGGRYLEVPETAKGGYLLDFNHAYNPYCAYNHAYSCPVVPLENILSVAIPAGEQQYAPYADKQH